MYFVEKIFYVFLPLFYLLSGDKLAVRLLYRASPVVWTAAEHVVITEMMVNQQIHARKERKKADALLHPAKK